MAGWLVDEPARSAPAADRLAVLEAEVVDLRRQVARLHELIGEVPTTDEPAPEE